jgi:hypothetical protein
MPDDENETELDRVAHNLWVLANMPPGGPEAFKEEARRLIEQRRTRESQGEADRDSQDI